MSMNKRAVDDVFGKEHQPAAYNPFDTSFPTVNSTPAFRETTATQPNVALDQYTASSVTIDNSKEKRFTYKYVSITIFVKLSIFFNLFKFE